MIVQSNDIDSFCLHARKHVPINACPASLVPDPGRATVFLGSVSGPLCLRGALRGRPPSPAAACFSPLGEGFLRTDTLGAGWDVEG